MYKSKQKILQWFLHPVFILCDAFHPVSAIERCAVKSSFIIFFVLQTVTGSTSLFTALLRKCLDREVVAVCLYIPGKNNPPRFVALLPQVKGFYFLSFETIFQRASHKVAGLDLSILLCLWCNLGQFIISCVQTIAYSLPSFYQH